MRKIREEAKQRKIAKEKIEEQKKKADEQIKLQKKEAHKKNTVRNILNQKRQNPKNINKGNLKGLDLEVKHSQLIYDKKAVPTEIDDDIFV